MEQYFANFIKTGNPNGGELPKWPNANSGDSVQFLRIDLDTRSEAARHEGRYRLLDKLASQPQNR
jgi:para-nitrobenzyl esterase